MKILREIIDIILFFLQIIAVIVIAYAIFAGCTQFNPSDIYMLNMWLFFSGIITYWFASVLEAKMEKPQKNGSRRPRHEVRV